MTSLLFRFWQYQWQRFPLVVLLCTTSSIVISSAGVQQVSLSENPYAFMAAVVVGIALLFNMRVLDDKRDFIHDNSFHKNRPVQQGSITLAELSLVNNFVITFALILLLFLGKVPLIYGLFSLLFSFIAGKDFFLGEKVKKYFLFYNCINFIQMLWVQLLIYAILDASFDIWQSVLWVHFLFAVANAAIIEVVRKIKPPAKESKGNDTYSWRLGFRGALSLYVATFILALGAYLWCVMQTDGPMRTFITFAICLSVFVALFIFLYDKKRTPFFERLLEGSAIFAYLFLHVSLYFV